METVLFYRSLVSQISSWKIRSSRSTGGMLSHSAVFSFIGSPPVSNARYPPVYAQRGKKRAGFCSSNAKNIFHRLLYIPFRRGCNCWLRWQRGVQLSKPKSPQSWWRWLQKLTDAPLWRNGRKNRFIKQSDLRYKMSPDFYNEGLLCHDLCTSFL